MTSDRWLCRSYVARHLALRPERRRLGWCPECDRVAFTARVASQLHVRGRRRGSRATVFDNRPRVPYVKIGQCSVSHVHVKTDICPEYLLSGWLCVTFPLWIARPVNDRPKIERLFDNWDVTRNNGCRTCVYFGFWDCQQWGANFEMKVTESLRHY